LSKDGFSSNGYVTDEDLSFEWNILSATAKKTNISVAAARDFSLLKKVQKELGVQ
jgi:hypothetical protein